MFLLSVRPVHLIIKEGCGLDKQKWVTSGKPAVFCLLAEEVPLCFTLEALRCFLGLLL